MKMRWLAMAGAAMVCAVVVACGPDTPAPVPVPAPTEWAAIDLETEPGYVALPDQNAGAVSELVIDDFTDVFALSDGGFLCYGAESVGDGVQTPFAARYDKDGNKVWQREYTDFTALPITAFTVLPDGGFAFAQASYVVECGADGAVVRSHRVAARELLYMDGTLFAFDEVGEPTDITITRIESDGQMTTRTYGGSDFDILLYACVDPTLGIVLEGRTQSTDGDFSARATGFDYFIARIDPVTLAVQWVYLPNADELLSISHYGLIVSNGAIYAHVTDGYGENVSVDKTTFLVKLSGDGAELWRTALFKNDDVTAFALSDGNLLTAMGGGMVLADTDGHIVKQVSGPDYGASRLCPTADGGFLAIHFRNIKTVPQPVYVSAIWYDTETTVTRLSKDLAIEWRKTYDNHRDQLGITDVWALEDGSRLLVEQPTGTD